MDEIKKPKRVLNCVTHHYACDCREWHLQELEKENENLKSENEMLPALRSRVEYLEKLAYEIQDRETKELKARIEELESEIAWEKEVKRALKNNFGESVEIIEELYNLDTLDSVVDKSYIDEAFRRASMFLQNNIYLKKKQGF